MAYRIAQDSNKLFCFGALNLPHTSHTFSCASSGTARTMRCPFGLNTLPATFFRATLTVVTCRMSGNWCTTIEFAIRDCSGSTLISDGTSVGFPGPCVLRSSLMWGEKCSEVTWASNSSLVGRSGGREDDSGPWSLATSQMRIVPVLSGAESPETRYLPYHGHQASACDGGRVCLS